jgi:hypothetical protein
MAGSFNNYLEDVLLDEVFGAQDYTPASDLYIALYTVAPTDAGGGTEVTGGSYARVQVTNDLTTWAAVSSGTKVNDIDFTFPTATGDWGTVVAAAILDGPAADNFLCWGDLLVNKVVSTGDTFRILTGNFTITLT